MLDVTSVPADLVAGSYVLHQNYPNPFNPETVIRFQIAVPEFVTIRIYDILGREVAVPVDTYLFAGVHQFTFNAAGLASGVYIYQIIAGEFIDSKRMVITK